MFILKKWREEQHYLTRRTGFVFLPSPSIAVKRDRLAPPIVKLGRQSTGDIPSPMIARILQSFIPTKLIFPFLCSSLCAVLIQKNHDDLQQTCSDSQMYMILRNQKLYEFKNESLQKLTFLIDFCSVFNTTLIFQSLNSRSQISTLLLHFVFQNLKVPCHKQCENLAELFCTEK